MSILMSGYFVLCMYQYFIKIKISENFLKNYFGSKNFITIFVIENKNYKRL